MFKLHSKYKDTEILWQRLILFTAGLILLIVYFDRILEFLGYILAICSPFFIGAALAFILTTIADGLLSAYTKIKKAKPTRLQAFVCNLGSLAIVAAIVALFLFLILPHAIDSFQRMSATLPEGIYEMYAWLLQKTENVPYIHTWLLNFSVNMENLPGMLDSVGAWLLSGGASGLMSSLYDVISTTFSWIITLFLSIAFAIILLFNRRTVVKEFDALTRAYLPAARYETILSVGRMVRATFTHYISGTCTECLILGTLVMLFATIFQLPYSFLSGIVVGVGALVPMFGALAAALVMTFFIAISAPLQAVYFIVLFLCIQNIEGNFIYPHVVGKFVEFPPMYVIVAVTLGANIAGVVGMIISIPICSILYQLIKQNARKRIQQRNALAEQKAHTNISDPDKNFQKTDKNDV